MKQKGNNSILIAIIIALAAVIIALAVIIVVVLMQNSGKGQHTEISTTFSEAATQETTTPEPITTEEPTTLLDITTFKTGEYTENGQTVESVLYDGGVKLEITDLSENSVSFTYTAISSAPANRIADVIVDKAEIVDGQVQFTFDDDGWFNRGTGYIKFLPDGKIEVKTKITRRDSEAMWEIGELKHTLSFAE